MNRKMHKQARGFSLIELLVVVLILTIVLGVVFTQIANVQRRYRQEESRLDMFQQAREAMDQLARDLHESGYPNYRMYAATVFGYPAGSIIPSAPAPQDNPVLRNHQRNAVGLVSLVDGEIIFEGDVDQDGQVDSVRYRINNGVVAGFTCPCLERSQVTKIAADPLAQGTNYQVLVENVVDFDFVGTDNNGTVVSSSNPAAGIPNVTPTSLMSIESLRVTLNVQGGAMEFDTNRRAESSFVITSRLPN